MKARRGVNRLWSKEDDQQLINMAGNRTAKQAALVLRRSQSAVYQRAYDLGIRWSQGRVTTALAAELLGVNRNTVRKYKKLLKQSWRYTTKDGYITQARGAELEDLQALATEIYTVQEGRSPPIRGSLLQLRRVARGEVDLSTALINRKERGN